MIRSHPGTRRDICEIASVAVAVSETSGGLSGLDGMRRWAEEGCEEGGVGFGLVWSGGVIRGEGDAVVQVGADDGGLCRVSNELFICIYGLRLTIFACFP